MIPTHKGRMEKIPSPFLRLPPELQTEVMNYLGKKSDLKALRLTSKQLSDIATPCLYYEVDLMAGLKGDAGRMRRRIKSLLLQPANLLFARILKTPGLGQEESQLMGRLLPLLKRDSLTRFIFSTKSDKRFPTPMQMKFIWNHQKKLQDQKLCWHIIPALEEILEERGPTEVALLQSFTMLDIDIQCRTHRNSWNINDDPSRPLKIIDLSILQNLRVGGDCAGSFFFPLLNTLFADGSFVNLIELSICKVVFTKTLRLINLPSLKSLALQGFKAGFPTAPLVLANDIRLSTFSGCIVWLLMEMTLILAQIKGLESLHIKSGGEFLSTIRDQQDFINGMLSQRDSLRVLNLELRLPYIGQPSMRLWEIQIVKAIECCKKLATLSIPRLGMTVSSYCDLIAALPDLETFNIYDSLTTYEDWSQTDVKLLFSTSTNLKVICFRGPLPVPEGGCEERFEREDVE